MARTTTLSDQRLRDIEILLLWEGQVGNARLREMYGIGLGAASILIKAYRETFAEACTWNSVERVFEAAPRGLSVVLSNGTPGDYAELLDRTGIPSSQVAYDTHMDLTTVSPHIFATLHRACARGQCVEIVYASMENPEPKLRRLFPRQMIQAGRRWHVRGLDMRSGQYRDFTIGRVKSVNLVDEPLPADAPVDLAWETQVQMQLIPHPSLTQAQHSVIRHEYMDGAAARVVTCRAAMLNYVIQELRIAVDVTKELPPSFQLALADNTMIRPWLFGYHI